MIDGLIHVSELKDDYYLFEEKNYSWLGKIPGSLSTRDVDGANRQSFSHEG
jgi:exoribonuclease R